MASMEASSLKNNLTNLARVYLWEVVIPSPVGGGDGNALEARCQSTTIPGRGVGRIHVPYKATAGIEYPGKIQMSHEWSCTFIEGTDGKVFDALHGWLEAILKVRTGQGSFDAEVKTDLYLRQIAQDNTVIKTFKMVGCFLQRIDDIALSYESEAAIMYNASFSYDHWEKV